MKPAIVKLLSDTRQTKQTLRRSIAKTISYRVFVLICDFIFIYLFTGQIKIALGFMIVSNTYATVGYYFHERIWNKIKWGKISHKKTDK
jgi:adenylylsulfate kinase